MEAKIVKLSKLKNNTGQIEGLPKNPRFIKDDKYQKLLQSLQDDPEMLELRELIAYDNNGELIVICGNMRLKALQELKAKEAPVKILPPETPIEKLKAYTVKDNIGYGSHDWDELANNWDAELLDYWGLDIPGFDLEPTGEDLIGEDKNKPATMKITFESPEQLQKAEIDIQEILDRKYPKAYFSVSAGEI